MVLSNRVESFGTIENEKFEYRNSNQKSNSKCCDICRDWQFCPNSVRLWRINQHSIMAMPEIHFRLNRPLILSIVSESRWFDSPDHLNILAVYYPMHFA